MTDKTAECRGCWRELDGEPYYKGGQAYHPITKKRCPVNHYGGFVCSENCDFRASLRLEESMPGCTGQTRLSPYAQQSLKDNWSSR